MIYNHTQGGRCMIQLLGLLVGLYWFCCICFCLFEKIYGKKKNCGHQIQFYLSPFFVVGFVCLIVCSVPLFVCGCWFVVHLL